MMYVPKEAPFFAFPPSCSLILITTLPPVYAPPRRVTRGPRVGPRFAVVLYVLS